MATQPFLDATEVAYGMGLTEAGAATGVDIMWNLPDLKSLDVLNRNTMLWVGDYYDSNVQGAFKAVLQEFFEGGYTRDQVAELLEQTFQSLGPRSKAYWDMLADHTCTKIREIGRVSGYVQAGVEYLEIRAWLDGRTTLICRSLHGRLIKVSSVEKFVENYLAACDTGDKEAVKAAWPMWSEKQFRSAGIAGEKSEKLAGKGVGLPPYHFRCRTITVSYFEVIKDGVNVVNTGSQATFWDGLQEKTQAVAWEVKDDFGRKITVTKKGLKHIFDNHGLVEEEIRENLKKPVNKFAYSQKNPGELIYLTRDNVFTAFRGNVLYNQFYPEYPNNYFENVAEPGTIRKVKKWQELFERFTGRRITS